MKSNFGFQKQQTILPIAEDSRNNVGCFVYSLQRLIFCRGLIIFFTVVIMTTVLAQSKKPNGLEGALMGQPGPGNPPPDDSGPYMLSGVYTVDGKIGVTASEKTYRSDSMDVSAVYVTNNGELTLKNATIITSGKTSSQSNSSFYGLNAAVLATKGSMFTMEDGTITTTGTGANGAIATDPGSAITLCNVRIKADNDGGHGVMATNGGSITPINVDITTSGHHSAPIATDRGSGTITLTGGTVAASGEGSPGIYSTGLITVSNLKSTATGSEAVVIEGKNSVILTNCTLHGEKLCGVMIYQSFSGDAEVGIANYAMTAGALTAASGPLFYITNTVAEVTLKDVNAVASSGQLFQVSKGRWGQEGHNGGNLTFIADHQTLTGDIAVDTISTLAFSLLNGSTFTGSIDADNTGNEVALTLDAASTWNVTADSYLSCLTNPDRISGNTINNIIGNGHTVYYDSTTCPVFQGKTYQLSGKGKLRPDHGRLWIKKK